MPASLDPISLLLGGGFIALLGLVGWRAFKRFDRALSKRKDKERWPQIPPPPGGP